MLKSSVCDYNDKAILEKETITVFGQGAKDATIAADRNNKKVTLKKLRHTYWLHQWNKTTLRPLTQWIYNHSQNIWN